MRPDLMNCKEGSISVDGMSCEECLPGYPIYMNSIDGVEVYSCAEIMPINCKTAVVALTDSTDKNQRCEVCHQSDILSVNKDGVC